MIIFLDYEIFQGDMTQLRELVRENIRQGLSKVLNFSAAHTFVCCESNQELKRTVNSGTIIQDGKPLEIYLKHKNPEYRRIRAADFMRFLLMDESPNLKHFFLGGDDKSLSQLLKTVKISYPGIKVSGSFAPPFTQNLELLTLKSSEAIRCTDANIIWVGLGAPKQFIVAKELSSKHKGVFVCVGAGFDYISGLQKEAPKRVQDFSLEWLYRLAHSPKRLWKRYTIDNLKFISLLFSDILKKRR